jgi:hypothetical protein
MVVVIVGFSLSVLLFGLIDPGFKVVQMKPDRFTHSYNTHWRHGSAASDSTPPPLLRHPCHNGGFFY